MSVLQSLSSTVLGLFYEEVDVARCLTFSESIGAGFTIPDTTTQINDRHIQFDAPGVLDGSVPVVFFQTVADASPASFSVRLNTTPHLAIATIENDNSPDSWHKLARPGALRPDHNELVLAVNEGSVTFSDVCIVYTSSQLTVRKRRTIVATQ